ncbi:MAG: tRNA (guanosine(37)-N1)-methyltransferase TrmD [Woeseiaceae bacterium]
MHIGVVSLFPEMVNTVVEHGVVGRASARDLVSLHCENPRDYATDVHRTVDDRPYGGGPGMVMTYQPTVSALRAARAALPQGSPVICLTPVGKVFDQQAATRLANLQGFILLAGRYEGIDERVIDAEVDEELSIGDYVLSGGELAAMVIIDAVVRLLPGVLGDDESAVQDSFVDGLLDYPHYTRPEDINGRQVPEVLRSGDHAQIARWRQKQALGRSYLRRPELIDRLRLSREQRELLDEFLQELK